MLPVAAGTSQGVIFSISSIPFENLPVAGCELGAKFPICTSKSRLLPVADTSEGLIFSVDTLKISLLPVAACD